MLIIGLAGGSGHARNEVADVLHQKSLLQWVTWACAELEPLRVTAAVAGAVGPRRARTLAQGLDNLYSGPRDMAGLIYSHVVTEEEAEQIRTRGGVIWHVRGVPSSLVVIRPGDAQVTPEHGGDRHYLDPLEALSELLLQRVA